MDKRDIIVVGASAGGIEPLTDLVVRLPADLAATVLVVVHLPADDETRLPEILSRGAELRVKLAEDGEPLQPGAILLAPPGRHLEINEAATALSCGPGENGFRPAIDVLFRSAAVAADARAVGVILSGALDDGAAGMVAVRLRGGVSASSKIQTRRCIRPCRKPQSTQRSSTMSCRPRRSRTWCSN